MIKQRKPRHVWTPQEDLLLKEHYPHMRRPLLENLFQQPISSITGRAYILGIKRRTRNLDQINGDLSVLLKDDVITYYWLGFLIGDGHFSKTNRLSICQKRLDKEHLILLATYLQTRIRDFSSIIKGKLFDYCKISIMDQHHISLLKLKFNLSHDKTHQPPDCKIFHCMSDDHFLSFLIGFIDANGCMDRTATGHVIIKLTNHKNWIHIYNYFINRLSQLSGCSINAVPRICLDKQHKNAMGLDLGVYEVNKFLKRTGLKFNLPLLYRKWDLIDLNRINDRENYKLTLSKIRNIETSNLTLQELSQLVGVNYKWLAEILRNEGLSYKTTV